MQPSSRARRCVTVDGTPSTKFTLPDGSALTLIGVAKAGFIVSFFKS